MSNNRENIKEHIEHLKKIGIDTESCFECGNKKDIEYHHIIPYSWGGRRVIPLCGNCHNMVHKGRQRKDNHRGLIKKGIEKKKQEAIAAGKEFKWGGAHNISYEDRLAGSRGNVTKADTLKDEVERALKPVAGLTLAKKVEYLNTKTTIRTRRGGEWTIGNLHRVLSR